MIVVIGLLVVAKVAIANTFLEGYTAEPAYICDIRDYGQIPDLKPVESNSEPLETLVRKTFPEDPDVAVAIVWCESGFREVIQSHHILDYGREESFGLFQIHARVWHDTAMSLGLTEYKTDAVQNAQMARYIYEDAGHSFSPWSCYSKGLIALK